MPGYEMLGSGAGRDVNEPADDARRSRSIADGREDRAEGGGIGVDELADDGRRRGEQRHADDTQVEHDMPRHVGIGVVPRIPDVPAVGEADDAHRQRNDAEQHADPVIHDGPLWIRKI